jgi:hypothetical protein
MLPDHCNYRVQCFKLWLTLPPYRAAQRALLRLSASLAAKTRHSHQTRVFMRPVAVVLISQPETQRGGAAKPPRTSCTTIPEIRGGGASQRGCARLVPMSLSPARHRRVTAAAEKSAILRANSVALTS